jgi:hypothetical protein
MDQKLQLSITKHYTNNDNAGSDEERKFEKQVTLYNMFSDIQYIPFICL